MGGFVLVCLPERSPKTRRSFPFPCARAYANRPGGVFRAVCGKTARVRTFYLCGNIDVNGPKTLTRTVVGPQEGLCVETTAWQAAANEAPAPDGWPGQWEQTCRFPAAEQAQQADYLARYFSPEKPITPQAQLLLPPAEPSPTENPLAVFLQKHLCSRPELPGERTVPPIRCTGTDSITVILPGKNGVPVPQTVRCEN